jgi:hypothetical protein
MERPNNTVLLVSLAPEAAQKQKESLESAGLDVVLVCEPEKVLASCRQYRPRIMVIGRSIPPAEKRRIWYEARADCPTPLLELHNSGPPELMQAAFSLEADVDDDFVQRVKILINTHK